MNYISKRNLKSGADNLDKKIGYDKYKWIINLSGKEFDEEKDMDSEIQMTRVLSFEEARAWRKLSRDYVRNRQWNDIEVDIRII